MRVAMDGEPLPAVYVELFCRTCPHKFVFELANGRRLTKRLWCRRGGRANRSPLPCRPSKPIRGHGAQPPRENKVPGSRSGQAWPSEHDKERRALPWLVGGTTVAAATSAIFLPGVVPAKGW